MTPRIYVDGHAGTIGLRIDQLLAGREDLSVLRIAERDRKNLQARAECLNACDVAVLCLPDDASRQAVALLDNDRVRVIDGSTAFRVDPQWVYGLPELHPQAREEIAHARFVSNPGCWPTGVSLLIRPLVDSGLLPPDAALHIHGVSGYSGAGKSGIELWESERSGLRHLPFEAPYSLEKKHKHLPEMQQYGGLSTEPYFRPSVGSFARGMRIQIPLHRAHLPHATTAERIVEAYRERYANEPFVEVMPAASQRAEQWQFDPQCCNGTNVVQLHVVANPAGHVVLFALLDNLGKGASGAAVQSLNLMLGMADSTGL